ncbi:MAG: DUF3052 domain-containing protein [Gemmatimonadota bacterium]|nr:DUF3052 domain-containing protein [Gemmatimonadota bacterium]
MTTGHPPEDKFVDYSESPLVKKLGIKPGFRIALVNPPDRYWDLVHPLPEGVTVTGPRARKLDVIHIFIERKAELARALPKARPRIRPEGMIWVSWPKKASEVATDVTEDVVRELALPQGLVDVKVCAIDETWSGLKLVIRVEQRDT